MASEIWSGRSAPKAAVIAGMKQSPMRDAAHDENQRDARRSTSCAPINVKRNRAQAEQHHAAERDAAAAEALREAVRERHRNERAESLRPGQQAGRDDALAADLW